MRGVVIGYLVAFVLCLVLIVGEIKCIVKLCQCDFEPSYKAECIYAVGTFTGFGGILGYIDFGK